MREYRRFTEAEDQHIRDCWRRDMTKAQIGAKIGRDAKAVQSRARVLGLPALKDPAGVWTPDLLAKVKRLYAEGVSPLYIGRQLGLTTNIVKAKLRREGALRRADKIDRAFYSPPPRPVGRARPAPRVNQPRQGGDGESGQCQRMVSPAISAVDNCAIIPLDIAKAFAPLPGREPEPFGGPGCKWSVGGDGADMLQCGALRVETRPYCTEHERAATPPEANRRKLDKSLNIPSRRRVG